MAKGLIFDVERYAIHDGPGIRTAIFFKGCPLHCLWCHNPEGIDSCREIVIRPKRCAAGCRDCISACPEGALTRKNGDLVIEQGRCNLCGNCAEACMYDALEIAGREVTVEDILQEVEKDRVFYDQSGGGVTLSGGEPLHQPEFLRELLEALRKSKIPVALDTTGHAPFEVLASIVPLADVVLYDLKLMDDEKHKKHTRVSNALILENLKKLARKRKDVIIRIPLIAGVNDDDENTRSTIDFLAPLAIRRVSVLPYHKGGVEKYKRLRKEAAFKTFAAPSEERIQEIMDRLLSAGFQVQRGG